MKKTYLFDDKAFETIEDALEAAEAAGWADDTQFENWLNRNFDAVDLFYRFKADPTEGALLDLYENFIDDWYSVATTYEHYKYFDSLEKEYNIRVEDDYSENG